MSANVLLVLCGLSIAMSGFVWTRSRSTALRLFGAANVLGGVVIAIAGILEAMCEWVR